MVRWTRGLMLLLLASTSATAQVPEKLSFQGRLLDAAGSPVTGILNNLLFEIYAQETGGAPLWSATQTLAATDGYYATLLDGSAGTTPFPATLFTGSPRYLSLTVDGRELLPRMPIASAAYALTAKRLAGGPVDATSVAIAGKPVIDGAGRWVGPGLGSDLRASFDFEEGAGQKSIDSSGYGSDVTFSTSGVSWTTAGHTGAALNFDGNSGSAEAPHQAALSPSVEITVSAWVYQMPGGGSTACVVSKAGQYALAIVGGQVRFSVQGAKGAASGFAGGGALPPTSAPAWTQVMASYDGANIRTFVNGFLTEHAAFGGGPIADSTSPLKIGACAGTGTANVNYFSGRIDEVRVFARAKADNGFRNVRRWQGAANDGTDNGVLSGRAVSYPKKAPGTGLRVVWSDNFRVATNNNACRWEVLFNGSPCPSGAVVFDKYEGNTGSNRHDMATVMGTCYGLPTGTIAVTTRVGPSPGYAGPDCYTGWNSQLVSLEVEEVQ